jgi:hypothetical protein
VDEKPAPMKALLLALCLFMPPLARGHVGSPNVFFQGKAGPHPVSVIIRPPATLPGIAQVDVRVADDDISRVALRAIFWAAGEESAPAPIEAARVSGETNLFHVPLWLLRKGSYNVQVIVESSRGRGSVGVPLTSAATQRPVMPPTLGAVLAVFGALLFLSAIWIAGAAARDATLVPGSIPALRDTRRGRAVTGIAALLLASATYGGTVRWRTMDREFRNNALAQPKPVKAAITNAGPLRCCGSNSCRQEMRSGGTASSPITANSCTFSSCVNRTARLLRIFIRCGVTAGHSRTCSHRCPPARINSTPKSPTRMA